MSHCRSFPAEAEVSWRSLSMMYWSGTCLPSKLLTVVILCNELWNDFSSWWQNSTSDDLNHRDRLSVPASDSSGIMSSPCEKWIRYCCGDTSVKFYSKWWATARSWHPLGRDSEGHHPGLHQYPVIGSVGERGQGLLHSLSLSLQVTSLASTSAMTLLSLL